MTDIERCPYCNGRRDRPGLHGCKQQRHEVPTLSQEIVADVERELHSRRGVGWEGVDLEIADAIRDHLAAVIERRLAGLWPKP